MKFSVLTIFPEMFDSYLIRPIDPLAHIVLKQFQYTFIARLFLALIFFADSIIHLGVVWNISKVIFLIVTVFSGFVIHSAILVLIGAISFWIIQNREFGRLLSEGNSICFNLYLSLCIYKFLSSYLYFK